MTDTADADIDVVADADADDDDTDDEQMNRYCRFKHNMLLLRDACLG